MKIKNVCECTGLTDRTIRYYIEENLISPEYTQSYNGRRTFEFSSEDVELLKQISVLRTFNFTIEEICAIKNDPHQTPKVILGVRTRTDAALTGSKRNSRVPAEYILRFSATVAATAARA